MKKLVSLFIIIVMSTTIVSNAIPNNIGLSDEQVNDMSESEFHDFAMRRAHRHYTTSVCPYGSEDDYYVIDKDHGAKSIKLPNAIKNMTRGAIVGLLTHKLTGTFPASALSGTFGAMYDSLLNNDPMSRAFGIHEVEYIHYKGKSVGGKIYIKHVLSYYYDEECEHYIGSTVRYEVFDW